jgi:hypothetical protein
MKLESEIQSAHAFVLNKQAALGPSAFEEWHSRQRFAWINDYLVCGVGEIAAAKVATIQADMSLLRLAAKYVYADSQAQRFHLHIAYLSKQTRKRTGVLTGVGLGAKVDAIVGSKYGAARQKSAQERQNCGDWTSSLASHGLLTSFG